jgi:hypothetical protein
LREPASLEEWASVGLGQVELPWLSPEAARDLQRSMSYFLLSNQLSKKSRKPGPSATKFAFRLLRKPLNWRLRHQCFALPIELWFSMAQSWLIVRRSLLTGEALSRQMKEAV